MIQQTGTAMAENLIDIATKVSNKLLNNRIVIVIMLYSNNRINRMSVV